MKDREDLNNLIEVLRKMDKKIWKRTAELLALPRKRRVEVNLYKLSKLGDEKKILLVPGKVLGSGNLDKKINVAAFSFSESAKKMLKHTKSKMIDIEDLVKENPEGKDVVLII